MVVHTDEGHCRTVPDLVVEVLSPSESVTDLEEKLADYRLSGTQVAWIVDSEARTVTIRCEGAAARVLHEGETVDGGDVIPGFEMPVSRLFERLAPVR